MGSLSDITEKKVLDHILLTAAYSPPGVIYLGLSTSDPLDDASGLSEPSGNGYARKAIVFGAASGRSISQGVNVEFDQATGAWGTITHFALFDSETGGTMLAHGSLTSAKSVDTGNSPTISAGNVVVSIASGGTSNQYADKILDWLFHGGSLPQPAGIYAVLVSVDIVDSDNAEDITDFVMTGYARTSHTLWNAATGTTATADNSGEISFGTLTGTGETIAAVALVDVVSGSGDVLFYDSSINQAVVSGTLVRFPAGDFNCVLS